MFYLNVIRSFGYGFIGLFTFLNMIFSIIELPTAFIVGTVAIIEGVANFLQAFPNNYVDSD